MYQNGFPQMPQYGTIGITQKTQNAFVKSSTTTSTRGTSSP
ncbi:hypothetical protein ACQ86N_16420 [Puia sp. P3]